MSTTLVGPGGLWSPQWLLADLERVRRLGAAKARWAGAACAKSALGVAVLVGAAACAAGDVPSGATSTSPSEVETATATPAPQASTWAGYLASLARSLRIDDAPQVTPVRVMLPEERFEAITACVADQGFPTDATGTRSFPDEQLEVFNLALYTCEARYPMEEKYLQPLSEEQVRRIHAYLVESAVPCLAALGYVVPDPPSVEAFVSTFGAPGGYVLSGQLNDLGVDGAAFEAALAQCPELPPSSELYT